jgi:phage gp29-like protein
MTYTRRASRMVPAQFAEPPPKRPEMGEVATTLDGRDITRGYVNSLPLLQPQDRVLYERAGGNYEIYEEIARDDQVKASFEQRRLAVVSREWDVEPGDTSRKAKKAADFLSEQLKHIGWDRVSDLMLWGVFYGYAVGELVYASDGAMIGIDAIKVRKQRRFGFSPDMELRLLTMHQPMGERLPPNKFWTFVTGADNDDEPYGLGLAHWLYWPVWFKRNGVKFWLIFLEKFGQPTSKGTYPAGATPEERTRLLQALQAITADSAITVPEGMQIELIEAARSGTQDYTALYDRMNEAISKVNIGQTMTTDDGSSRSQSETHMEVRQDFVKADADLICESFNRGPVLWLTYWNFGEGVPCPRVWRDVSEPEDLEARSRRDKNLRDIGFRPTLKEVTDVYGGEWMEVAKPTADPDEPAERSFGRPEREAPISPRAIRVTWPTIRRTASSRTPTRPATPSSSRSAGLSRGAATM